MKSLKPSVQVLPHRLCERTRVFKDSAVPTEAAYVLYWMHYAVRGHENPALDTVVFLGNRLGLPVLV
jgi:hypothetical protein